jgi:WD40 repeat protein
MVEMNWLPIVSNALHVYHSATVNLPYCSLLERYQSETHTYPYLVFGRRTSWGSTCRIVEGNDGSVDALAISPDGDVLCSGSSVGTIRVWSAATGALRMVLHGHDDSAITAVSFSSDSSRLVSSSWDRSLVVWGAENGELVLTVAEAHRLPVTSVAYSPTQDAIASGSWDGNIHVWDSLNGRLLSSMEMDDWDSFKIHSIAFSNDGCYIASACSDNNVRLWNMVADDEPQVLMGHQQACTSVAWSQDGLILISGSEDGTVLAWDMTQARHDCVAVHIGSHTSPVTSVAVSSDSSWVAFGSLDNTLRLIQIKSGNLTATFEGHQGPINSVKFSHSNAEVLSGSEDGTMRIWDVLDGSYRTSDEDASVDMDAHTLALERKHTTTPSSPVQSLSFSHDGSRIAAGFDDGSIHVWDVASETRVVQLYLDAPVDSLALSPFGAQLGAVDSDENFTLWSIEDGNIVARLDTPIMGIAFSPVSPDIALCLGNRTVEVWQATDTPGMERIRTYNATRDWVVAVAFSSTGTYLASASHKGTLRVWSTSTSALLFKWKHLRPDIDIFSVSVQFIHDRALLLTDRSGKTNMMMLEGTPTRPHTIEDRDHLVPDLVVDDADEGLNQIERYYPPTGQGWVMYKMKLEDDGRRVCWLPPERRAGAFAQHGHLFATGAEGGTVTIIDFSRLSHV